jgi:deoxyribodipyrimidine photo-lyase
VSQISSAVAPAKQPIVVWFRRDLRLGDHPALKAAIDTGKPIIPLFVWDPRLLDPNRTGSRRVNRLEQAVAALDRDLHAVGGRLVIRRGPPVDVVPGIAREAGAAVVHASRDYTPYAVSRDERVGAALDLRLHPGTLVVEPEAIGDRRIFTPFHRRWLAETFPEPLAAPQRVDVPAGLTGEPVPSVSPDGEREARARLARFAGMAGAYAATRDRIDLDGTSRLGADLHLGTLSPNQVLAEVGDDAFRRQLAWRDWASHVLWFRPAARREAWREDGRGLDWLRDELGFDAWRDGRTGYPVVDAAMRQLRAEGWMHGRARMIVASFLTKDLLIDWRLGEAEFLRELVDGDVANNSLGWQWTAGVGTDAAPFFRVFNPVRQGERFDPAGTWVRRWVPEIADLPDRFVHHPWDHPGGAPRGYPPPIVDHARARARALAWFRDRPRSP